MNVKTLETFTPLSCSLKVLDRISKVYAYIKEDHINSSRGNNPDLIPDTGRSKYTS